MAYSQEDISQIKTKICEKIAIDMLSLRKVTSLKDMPSMPTILDWLKEDNEFSMQYARACEIRADGLADEILDIADTPMLGTKTKVTDDGTEITTGDMIEHRRLQVEARKWSLSKMMPKKYGDKIDVTSDGDKLDSQFNLIIHEVKKEGES